MKTKRTNVDFFHRANETTEKITQASPSQFDCIFTSFISKFINLKYKIQI